jgi:hypothetical protein
MKIEVNYYLHTHSLYIYSDIISKFRKVVRFVTAEFISMTEGPSRESQIVKNLLTFYENLRFHLFSKNCLNSIGVGFPIFVRIVREIKQTVLGGLKQTDKLGDIKHINSS